MIHTYYMFVVKNPTYVIRPGLGTQVLFTKNTLVRNMPPISCTVCAIQKLLVLLNSLWSSTYMMTF